VRRGCEPFPEWYLYHREVDAVPDPKPLPKYRLHKGRGLAAVTLSGRHFYLGKYGPPESLEQYNRMVNEWVASRKVIENSTRANRFWSHARSAFPRQDEYGNAG
jgi:hypothetical protein